tara:strand:- start:925 stop:1026 length:102 start_codon:yes stop_codon:yes gene_type:complete
MVLKKIPDKYKWNVQIQLGAGLAIYGILIGDIN